MSAVNTQDSTEFRLPEGLTTPGLSGEGQPEAKELCQLHTPMEIFHLLVTGRLCAAVEKVWVLEFDRPNATYSASHHSFLIQ
jgi:hypothetical protein